MTLRALVVAGLVSGCVLVADEAAGQATQAWTSPSAFPVIEGGAGDERPTTRQIIDQVSRSWFLGEWRAYVAKFVTPEGRVIDNANGGVSHSEGQGYGLLLAAFAGDREQFQLIWNWTEKHLKARSDPLLSWRWDPAKGTNADENNATDGDILVAWALAKGARQFGRRDYRKAAKEIAQAIGAQVVRNSDHGLILMPGAKGFGPESQPDGPVINLSYWVFPAFSTLSELAPQYDWEKLRQNGLALLAQSRFSARGLPADWESLAGPSIAPAKNFPPQFGYDAIRIPLYLAWNGDEASRRSLIRFVPLWRGKNSAGPFVIDVNSGATGSELDGVGYRMILELARCASTGQPIDGELVKSRDRLYYPSTLRMLSLAVIQERFPQCL